MIIRFHKGDDSPCGRDTLVCIRDDGAQIWSKLVYKMPYHDLTHYAVETTLGLRNAFYGLLAQGWTVEQFTEKNPETGRYPSLPDEAVQAESLVVLFQGAAAGGTPSEQVLETLEAACIANGVPPMPINSEQLDVVRDRLRELWQAWDQLLPGEILELDFGT